MSDVNDDLNAGTTLFQMLLAEIAADFTSELIEPYEIKFVPFAGSILLVHTPTGDVVAEWNGLGTVPLAYIMIEVTKHSASLD